MGSRMPTSSRFLSVLTRGYNYRSSWILSVSRTLWSNCEKSSNPSSLTHRLIELNRRSMHETAMFSFSRHQSCICSYSQPSNHRFIRGFSTSPDVTQDTEDLSAAAPNMTFEIDDRDDIVSKEDEHAEEHKRRKLSDVRSKSCISMWNLVKTVNCVF